MRGELSRKILEGLFVVLVSGQLKKFSRVLKGGGELVDL
jgi:hypothetical protein